MPLYSGFVTPVVLISPCTRTMTGPAGTVELTDLQFAVVAAMVRRPGMTCPTGLLLRDVWGARPSPDAAARRRLEVLVSRLRSRRNNIKADKLGIGRANVAVMGMQPARQHGSFAAGHAVCHHDRLGTGSRAVVKRGVDAGCCSSVLGREPRC